MLVTRKTIFLGNWFREKRSSWKLVSLINGLLEAIFLDNCLPGRVFLGMLPSRKPGFFESGSLGSFQKVVSSEVSVPVPKFLRSGLGGQLASRTMILKVVLQPVSLETAFLEAFFPGIRRFKKGFTEKATFLGSWVLRKP